MSVSKATSSPYSITNQPWLSNPPPRLFLPHPPQCLNLRLTSLSKSVAPLSAFSPTWTDERTQRKLEDALQSLDEAVGPSTTPSIAPTRPPLKKLRTSRSIYAMLAKYGIKKDPKPYVTTVAKVATTSFSTRVIVEIPLPATLKPYPRQLLT